MDTSEHGNLVPGNGVDDEIWKSAQQGAAQLAAKHLILVRITADGLDRVLQRAQKIVAASRTLIVVPIGSLGDLEPRTRPNNRPPAHLRRD
jgi:hypothetical protein